MFTNQRLSAIAVTSSSYRAIEMYDKTYKNYEATFTWFLFFDEKQADKSSVFSSKDSTRLKLNKYCTIHRKVVASVYSHEDLISIRLGIMLFLVPILGVASLYLIS